MTLSHRMNIEYLLADIILAELALTLQKASCR